MNNDFYEKFEERNNSSKKVGSLFVVPFISGIVGASLVIGVTFGTPGIREKIFDITTINEKTALTSSSFANSSNQSTISLKNYSDTSIFAANKVLPSIVGITVEYNVSAFGITQTSKATGSGIIISEDGYILTNNHIVNSSDSSSFYQVSNATKIVVSLYKETDKTYEATIVGTDELTDLAVIKIEASSLVPAELGNSDSLQVGEFVLAVGSPLGLETSVTAGIVSGLNRNITSSEGTSYTVTQTDCAINAGNSGGALVNSNGQVVGINTLKLAGTGIEGVGFAIPINDTMGITKDLIENGKVIRPYIGFSGSNLEKAVASRYNLPIGVYVESVSAGSGAADAGLKKGDVITKADGQDITTMQELNNIKNKKSIGDTFTLTVYRNGKTVNLNVILSEMP